MTLPSAGLSMVVSGIQGAPRKVMHQTGISHSTAAQGSSHPGIAAVAPAMVVHIAVEYTLREFVELWWAFF